jgi:Fic family protein
MIWNWQQPGWPIFTWDAARLAQAERIFAENAGLVIGVGRHLEEGDRQALTIEVMCLEAIDTSAIEGEVLDRDSVQASIRRQLGLAVERRKSEPAEAGIAEMMVALYRNLIAPLDHETLFAWHQMVTNGRRDLTDIGRYRRHADPMQIISGADYAAHVHFEAPPSKQVPAEMDRFLAWLHDTSPAGNHPLPPITRAGIAHLWFESIHPFEDGNGRIGRAIIEKSLAQGLSIPTLTAVAGTLLRRRKQYYHRLEQASQTLEITDWLLWFAAAVIEAQRRSLALVEFILHKAKLLNRVGDRLNPRQEKAVLRLFAAGPDGFVGGLSAGNYRRITGAPPATSTRDLVDLVELGVLHRTGERKATRYYLTIPIKPIEIVRAEDL